jgi:hypothetical protein
MYSIKAAATVGNQLSHLTDCTWVQAGVLRFRKATCRRPFGVNRVQTAPFLRSHGRLPLLQLNCSRYD